MLCIVQKFTSDGTWLATFGSGLNQPRQIEVNNTTQALVGKGDALGGNGFAMFRFYS